MSSILIYFVRTWGKNHRDFLMKAPDGPFQLPLWQTQLGTMLSSQVFKIFL